MLTMLTEVKFYAAGAEHSDYAVRFKHTGTRDLWAQLDKWMADRGEDLKDYHRVTLTAAVMPVKI